METGWAAAFPASAAAQIPRSSNRGFVMRLERKFQSYLHLPRSGRGAGDAAHRGRVQGGARRSKTGGVRQIERLPAELQARALAQLELLEQREIDGAQNIRRQDAQSGVAVRKV